MSSEVNIYFYATDMASALTIPGAILNEPLENSTIPALKWWLLCRGIKHHHRGGNPRSQRGKAVYAHSLTIDHRHYVLVCEAKEAGIKVVNVDGSYSHHKSLQSSLSVVPVIPLTEWEHIESAGSKHVDKIPIW